MLHSEHHASGWLQSSDLEDAKPSMDPIVPQKSLRNVPLADLEKPLWLSFKASDNVAYVRSVFLYLDDCILPIEYPPKPLVVRSLSDHHSASRRSLKIPVADLELALCLARRVHFGRCNNKITASLQNASEKFAVLLVIKRHRSSGSKCIVQVKELVFGSHRT